MKKIVYNTDFKTVIFDYDGTMFNTEVMLNDREHACISDPRDIIKILESTKRNMN